MKKQIKKGSAKLLIRNLRQMQETKDQVKKVIAIQSLKDEKRN